MVDIAHMYLNNRLEIDSPSRGRKREKNLLSSKILVGLEIDSPSRGRKLYNSLDRLELYV